jgi:hypothetical protein
MTKNTASGLIDTCSITLHYLSLIGVRVREVSFKSWCLVYLWSSPQISNSNPKFEIKSLWPNNLSPKIILATSTFLNVSFSNVNLHTIPKTKATSPNISIMTTIYARVTGKTYNLCWGGGGQKGEQRVKSFYACWLQPMSTHVDSNSKWYHFDQKPFILLQLIFTFHSAIWNQHRENLRPVDALSQGEKL